MSKSQNNTPAAPSAAEVDVNALLAENEALKQAVKELSEENEALKKAGIAAVPTITLAKKSYELTAARFMCTLKGHSLFGQYIGAAELAEDSELAAWALQMGLLAGKGEA